MSPAVDGSDDPTWLRADMEPDDPGSQGHTPLTPERADLVKRIAEDARLVKTTLLLGGPNSEALVEMEREVFDRARRLQGWTAAAKLHRETLVDDFGSVCPGCTDVASKSERVLVEWPCATASALGLDR